MKQLPLILYFFVVLITLVSCSTETKNEIVNTENQNSICDNETSLFSISDTTKIIEINYSDDREVILDSIENKFNYDICEKRINFGLLLKNNDTINLQIRKECAIGYIKSGPKAFILITNVGDILFDNYKNPIDSVKNLIKESLLYRDDFSMPEIAIQWKPEAPIDSIEKVLLNIEKGYMIAYNSLSNSMFRKTICELNKSQFDSLENILPFNILIYLPKPPPKPIEFNNQKKRSIRTMIRENL